MGYFNPKPERNILTDIILKWIVDVIVVVAFAVFMIAGAAGDTKSAVTPDRHAILTVRSRQCKSYLKTLHPYL